jgi:hypothetical protein
MHYLVIAERRTPFRNFPDQAPRTSCLRAGSPTQQWRGHGAGAGCDCGCSWNKRAPGKDL